MTVRSQALGAVLLAAAALAGCGGPSPARPARPSVSPSFAYADPACPSVLAVLAGIDADQAASTDAGMTSLHGLASPGSTLAGLVNGIRADLLDISFDQSGLSGSTSSDLSRYQAGVAQVRAFCNGGG